MNNEFNILFRLHRRSLTEQERMRDIKTPLWIYPLSTEKVYAKELSKIMKDYINIPLTRLETSLRSWIIQSRRDAHSDAWEQSYKEFIEDMEKALAVYFGTGLRFDNALGLAIQKAADRVLEQSIRQWNKQTEAVLGDPYSSVPPDWGAIKNLWMEENYRAMRSLAEEYNKKLSSSILSGLLASWSYTMFSDHIQTLNKKMASTRAGMIARGQIGILVGQVIKNYAQGIGNDEYIWQTSLDERVRGNPKGIYPKALPSHWAMEGMICKWSDSTVYSVDGKKWLKRSMIMPMVPVGMDWGCRCTAGLAWGNFLNKLDI